MSIKTLLLSGVAAAIGVGAAPAFAAVLYSNPLNGTIDADNIFLSSGWATESPFTVTSNATAMSVDFGAWVIDGTVTSLNWGINTDPNSWAAPHTAAVTTGPACGSSCGQNGFFSVDWDNFSLGGGVALQTGVTYWLVLAGASTNNGSIAYWDRGSGGTGHTLEPPNVITDHGANTFDVIGGGVPEPSTWAMMGLGFAGLAYAGFRSQRRKVAASA
jgi:hypothetical protein